MEIFVHDTAFMIAYYRAQHEVLSRDPFAKLWLRPGLERWANEFAEAVSEHDEILHSLRNRFFHDALDDLITGHESTLFINLGAGFSMYPYVLPEEVVTIEVDFEEIISYKKHKLVSFENQQKIPMRKVIHQQADITTLEGQLAIQNLLKEFQGHRKVILIEGVFFFLSEAQIASTISFCKQIMNEGDHLLCVSFDDSVKQTDVFERLTCYFSEVLKSEHNPHTTLPHRHYKTLSGFELVNQSSGLELGRMLEVLPNSFSEEEILNEYYYVLKRKPD